MARMPVLLQKIESRLYTTSDVPAITSRIKFTSIRNKIPVAKGSPTDNRHTISKSNNNAWNTAEFKTKTSGIKWKTSTRESGSVHPGFYAGINHIELLNTKEILK